MKKSSYKKSPKKDKLLKQVINLRKQNNRLRLIVRRLRLKQEKKKATEKEVNDVENIRQLSGKLFSGNFLKLLSAQIDALTKNKRGRRYDSDFKQFALSLFFTGPRNYRELIKHFALPSVRSLHLFTQSWKIVPGINDKIFDALNEILLALPPIERHCILTVDEMSLKSHLFYNISEDEIIGFEDTGYEKSHKPAKSALVLMARSIAGNWKFPVCFCLIETACQSSVLKKIIFDIIVKLQNSNSIVHALVSDMGSNFKQLSRELGISTQNTTFLVNGQKVLYIFDTPHLVKAIRNNLLKYNFLFDINKIVSWKYIVDFYNKDSKQWIKMAPNLTKCHLEPNGFQRMKVKYAVQVFSNRVAAGMCTQMSYGSLPSEAVGTIDFIEKIDKLFDILNSSSLNNPKEYGKVFTGSEKQIMFLKQMLHLFKDIKVIDANGSLLKVKIPCFECWQITIKSIIQLWDTLKSFNFPYLRTRKINQDCVENFFGSIRQQGGNSVNPTPIQFVRAFKKLLSTKFLQHSEGQNCAQDSDQMLNIMKKSYLKSNTNISPSVPRKILDIPSHDYYSMDLPEQNAFTYVCGYLIKKCLENHSCNACITYVNESKAVLNDTTLYCSFRAYSSEENNLYANLYVPNNTFCSYIHQLEELFVKNFENNCFKKNIGNYLFQLAQTIAFEPPCSDFPKIVLIKLFLRMRIYFTLSQHNKSCKSISKKNRKLLNVSHL